MKTYQVALAPSAARQLRKLDRPVQRRIVKRLEKLGAEPLPGSAVKLKSAATSLYRIREGSYRIVYTIQQNRLLVLIIRIGHRSEVYR